MNARLRQQRTTFLLYLGTVYVALMCALPIITATIPTVRYAKPEPIGAQPTFENLDRNRDGYVDRAEATALPGLNRVLDTVSRRADGRVDKVEYARALAMLDSRK
jgi:hypothetical protein